MDIFFLGVSIVVFIMLIYNKVLENEAQAKLNKRITENKLQREKKLRQTENTESEDTGEDFFT